MWSSSTTQSAESGEPTGVLGGTFDPVHLGHVVTAEQVRGKAGLSQVWLMPNAEPPHRAEPPLASPLDRLAMVRLAVEGRPGLGASDIEVRRGGPSYTIDSLEALQREHPDRSFTFLLGYDVALAIQSWYRWERLLVCTAMVIFNRAGEPRPARERLLGLGFEPDRTRLVEIDAPPISAREIRARLARGEPIEGLVPAAVAAYIQAHHLYAKGVG